MKVLHYSPFPERNGKYKNEDIFYHKIKTIEYYSFCYNKSTSPEAITISNQFFLIEEIILSSFQYVLPIKKNSETCSVKFATVIRESCNLFETIMRKLYRQFFNYNTEYDLNIYNFLSLDEFLKLSEVKLKSPQLDNYLNDGKSIEPYKKLKDWDISKKLNPIHVPTWWIAHNRIKHATDSIIEFATLNNAILSIAAIFILIEKIYGSGLISSFLHKPSDKHKNELIMYQTRSSKLFFGETLKRKI